jgi:drug/metabolite transporter (DMT)-like permease
MSPTSRAADIVKVKKSINPFLVAFPATFDICASTLMFIALG